MNPAAEVRRLYPAQPLLAVSVALFRHDEILLVERAKPPFERYYSLPGGLVEPGETLAEAAQRELWEEVEMRAQPLTFNRHVEMIEKEPDGRIARHYLIVNFAGLWESGSGRLNDEARGFLWAKEQEIDGLPLTPGLAPVISGGRALVTANPVLKP